MATNRKGSKLKRALKTLVGSLILTPSIGYVLIAFYHSFVNDIGMSQSLLNYNSVLDWIGQLEGNTKRLLYLSPFIVTVLTLVFSKPSNSTYSDAAEHGVYGSSEFSDLSELKDNGFVPEDDLRGPRAKWSNKWWSQKGFETALKAPEGIILGREGKELVLLHNESKLDNRNVLVVGSSGSSKGQAFVIPNLINNYTSSMIVTDPKGELYDLFSELKKDQGYEVHQVDFLNLQGSRYNPLDYIFDDMGVKRVADSISRNSSKDGKEDFFFNAARDLLVGLISYEKSINPNANMKDVKATFNKISNDETGVENLKDILEEIGSDHEAYQYLYEAYTLAGNTRPSVMSSFAQQTGIFSLRKVSDFTKTSDLNFEDIQKKKTIIFVKVPIKNNPVEALTEIFFDQLFSILYEIGDRNGSVLPIPTICMLDEFANLGRLNDYDNILSTCRGYGLSLLTIIQDFAQLEEKYSERKSRTFINNHDTTLFLRTKDQKTAEYFEAAAGKTTARYETKSKQSKSNILYYLGWENSPGGGSPSSSENYTSRDLVSRSELLRMTGDDCYVFMAGRVLKLEKAFQSTIYKGFITAAKPVKKRYPYVYPENREGYLKILEKKGLKFEENNAGPEDETSIVDSIQNQEVINESKPIITTPGQNKETETSHASEVATTTVDEQLEAKKKDMSKYAQSIMANYKKDALKKSKAEATKKTPSEKLNNEPQKASEVSGSKESNEDIEEILSDPNSLKKQQALAFSISEEVEDSYIGKDESSQATFDLLKSTNILRAVRRSQESYELMNHVSDIDSLTAALSSRGSLMQNDEPEDEGETEETVSESPENLEEDLPFKP